MKDDLAHLKISTRDKVWAISNLSKRDYEKFVFGFGPYKGVSVEKKDL